MKGLRILGVFIFVFLLLSPSIHAIPGDVDGSGTVALADITYLISYLFTNGPAPVVRNDADVDNCPGISVGDVYQITDFIYSGGQLFLPVGTDLVVPSDIKITTGFVQGAVAGQIITVNVKINTVGQPNLYGVVIPLSYANLPGETQVTCNNVNFTGTLLATSGAFAIDAPNQRVLIFANGGPTTPVIPTGSNGIIARIDFQVVVPGTHNEILPTYFTPENTPLLISQFSHVAGNPPGRMLLPKLYTSEICDAGGDNSLTIADVVYIISFLFRGGPPPIND